MPTPFRIAHQMTTLAMMISWSVTAPALLEAQVESGALDALVREVRTTDELPSLSVAVLGRDGEVVTSVVGLADLELGVPATARTRYPIGSVSKALTAVAALRLVGMHRWTLADPVGLHCAAASPQLRPITIGQLLAHTGGVRHYDYRRFEEDYLNKKRYASLSDALAKFAADSLRHPPGTAYLYSSWGYVLLGCALEGAGGGTFGAVLDTLVLAPAGMSATRLDEVAAIIPDRARSYYRPENGPLANAGLFDPSDRSPAGGILSTPTDLVRFGARLTDGLLSDALRDLMWREARLGSGESTGHGLGWDVAPDGTAAWVGGTSVGSTTFLYVDRVHGTVVAFATNLAIWDRDRLALARRIAAVAER